ncbi:MAG: SRPBCC family protein, partial [Solirubrobacterales bacterium]|nr:SRPBCC family protein [Solirubrobacterales bacterium]
MASYEFLTAWLLDAPREDVWDAIWDSGEWPTWWRGVVEAVETDPGTACGIGRRGRYAWRSRIPYPVRFEVVSTVVERPNLLEGEATGELEGVGRWRFLEQDGATAALYEWNVHTTKPWMNLVAPLARPVFRWNHDQVMRWGGEGLA